MALTTAEINDLWNQLAKDIPARGLLVFPAGIQSEAIEAMWPTDKDVAGFLDFAQKLDVRVVYLSSEVLAPDTLLELVASMLPRSNVALEYDTAEEFFEAVDILSDSVVADYLSFGRERFGRKSTIRVEWVHDGVVHRFFAVANWLGKLMDKAAEVSDLLEPEETEH